MRAQAFGVPSFPVDTHIHRCALRWGLTDRLDERDPNKVSAALRSRFPEASWNKLHLQMIFMGREHCVARRVARRTQRDISRLGSQRHRHHSTRPSGHPSAA